MAEIRPFEFEVNAIQNQLLGLTVLAGEYGAQILMPRNDQIEGLVQMDDIQLAPDGDPERKVVGNGVGLKLVDKP